VPNRLSAVGEERSSMAIAFKLHLQEVDSGTGDIYHEIYTMGYIPRKS
jgi:hypothetical protein